MGNDSTLSLISDLIYDEIFCIVTKCFLEFIINEVKLLSVKHGSLTFQLQLYRKLEQRKRGQREDEEDHFPPAR